MRRLYAFAALLAALANGPQALADGSGPMEPFPITGAYSAFFREDREQITIIDFAGNYDRNLAGGAVNVEPRAVIAREFLRTHPDQYDFLVAFSTFEVAQSPPAVAPAAASPAGGAAGGARVGGTYSKSHSA